MPILWRYLLKQYVKVLLLAVVTFIAILFVSRLKQIAELAAVGAGAKQVLIFALYLIPYVLPIALPIACLLASIVLFQRLSRSHELTALRASGMRLRQVVGPILITATALSFGNFYVASELATHCHMLGARLEKQTASFNPLLLLQNTQLLRLGDLFVDMRTESSGERAADLTLFAYNRGTERLNLISAHRLELKDEVLEGNQISLLTGMEAKGKGFDHLVIENQAKMWTPASSFSHLLKQMTLNLKNSHLRLKLLMIRIAEETNPVKIHKGYSEIVRRCSLALAVFSFTIMGCAFGIQVGREASKRRILTVIGLTTLFIACFSVANGLDSNAYLSATLSLLPHFIIIPLSIWTLRRVAA